MACITKRKRKDNKFTYQVCIRKKGVDISKSFFSEEDAILYSWWKENLIQNMSNFECDIKDTVTIIQVLEMKQDSIDKSNSREISSYDVVKRSVLDIFGEDKNMNELTYDDWKSYTETLKKIPVYRGGKNEACKRVMSPTTLRRRLAYISSSIGYAQRKGIAIDNHPLKIIQQFYSCF